MKRRFKVLFVFFMIFFMVFFPLLWLFAPDGIVLDVYVHYTTTTPGDMPAGGISYVIRDQDGVLNPIVATGTVGADGHILFFPQGTIAVGYYRLSIDIHGNTYTTLMNNGSFSESYDRIVAPWFLDAQLDWDIIFNPVDSQSVDLLKWNGASWDVYASLTTDSLGNVDFYIGIGKFSFNPSAQNITVSGGTNIPIIGSYVLSPTLIIISIIGVVIAISKTLKKNKVKVRRVRGKPFFPFILRCKTKPRASLAHLTKNSNLNFEIKKMIQLF
ncbi:hypothetical protein LCGC14_0804730 [marine sediment metagenome]|uniref:Uncharacterized protein n=1 Tax=marine sediment metagenome TaxID=412755 RepID=A0A0F9PNJ8_9ZZZZ